MAMLLSLVVSAGLVICWSSGFIGTRLASGVELPATTIFFWRFLLAAGICLLLLVGRTCLFGQRARLSLGGAGRELAAGSLSVGGYLLGVVFAIELGVSAGITSLITALQPLLAALVMSMMLGERIALLGWLGSLLAALGVVISVTGDMSGAGHAPVWAYALPILSAISLTAGSMLSTYRPAQLGLIERLMRQLLAAAVIFGIASVSQTGHLPGLPRTGPGVWQAILFLVVLSSFGGYGFFIASLRLQGVTATSVMFYLTPPCTMLWAALQLGERISTAGWLGGATVAIGVMLSLRVLWQSAAPSESRRAVPKASGRTGSGREQAGQ
ncbi:EamA-like transporter family protein [Kushneria sinocarnis]|uniref:EamA-like transporter family protein n=1 Tax=Kushneria sinocarnis TaxID=595502 RepID=A0A420WU81_9GAMM|nr:DMT family transporter [Kushneria sinocarnis]RKQ97003.1 EamA-like transporter family protein [Kushneria sinocarnis]